jgi:hypothetical protein
MAACLDGELFIASQVGLPDLQHRMWNEHRINVDDHVFHRLAVSDLTEVDAASTIDLTAPQLLGQFRNVATRRSSVVGISGWDVVEAARQLGLDRT